MSSRATQHIALLAFLACTGCGGAEKPAEAPRAMPSPHGSAAESKTEGATTISGGATGPASDKAVTSPPPVTPIAPPSAAKMPAPGPTAMYEPPMVAAEREVADAESRLKLAGGDCTSLCKALASMKRATEHLCELTQGGGDTDKKRCTDAQAKLDAARAKVKATCGAACG